MNIQEGIEARPTFCLFPVWSQLRYESTRESSDSRLAAGLTLLMLSMPPATTMLESPILMDWAARHTALRPDPQII